MAKHKKRFYQPTNSKDAMREIEKLFNQYKDAPLTKELLDYHQNLINRLNSDILAAAKKENIPQRIKAIQSMTEVMQHWAQVKLAGKPYEGKMEHFHFVADSEEMKFKRHVTKINGNNSMRSTRH